MDQEQINPESATLETIAIATPEQIHLEYALAGIGSRFLALAIDTFIQFGVFLGLFLAVILLPWLLGARLQALSEAGGMWFIAVIYLLGFLVNFGYFAYFETVWKGQTPGKRQQNLRVMKDDGRPITAFDAIGRNLMRIVDTLPALYACGIICVFLSKHRKRLGDYLVGTIVVHDRPLGDPGTVFLQKASAPVGPSHAVTADQFQLLETYLSRRYDLDQTLRRQLRAKIIERLAATMEITAEDREDPDALIERLVGEYRNQ